MLNIIFRNLEIRPHLCTRFFRSLSRGNLVNRKFRRHTHKIATKHCNRINGIEMLKEQLTVVLLVI